MSKPEIQNNVVTFSNGITHVMPAAHEDYCYEFDGFIFLILHYLKNKHRNIWCFDQEGNKLWEFEPSLQCSLYYFLEFDEKNGLSAYDQQGDTYAVDMKTGYINWLGGDRGEAVKGGKNKILRERRAERLKAERET